MKKLLILLITLTFATGYAQDTKKKKKERIYSYTASNGVTYSEGDTIVLNRGSGDNARFVYVGTRGRGKGYLSGSEGSGYRLKVARMIETYKSNYRGVDFLLFNKMKIPFDLDIENAIASCEITPCEQQSNEVVVLEKQDDKYDKLAKIKRLFDEGVLTQEEYDDEKKTILKSEN